ncbi:hypothetical protein [Paenibacillus sp. NRS-1760]|uniref:hypothetical protein n=1 Tax=Paenibacillus sp. NRS-1760 TaxID=3233902 RepID=UPI003D2DED99
MFRATTTNWQWTAVAEAEWQKHNVEPRRAGQILMERDREGIWVKRTKVPANWVDKGYVKEAAAEQTTLF